MNNSNVAASLLLKLFHCSGKVGRLQDPCEFPESANILSSTSVYINEEFSKPTISICNQEENNLIAPFICTYHLPLTSLKGTSNNLFLIKRVNRSICFISGTGFGVSLDPGTPVSALPEDPGALFLYRFGSS
jgi:hypothetical protein